MSEVEIYSVWKQLVHLAGDRVVALLNESL